MIIVKITLMTIIITVFYIIAIRFWASSNPMKAVTAQISHKYPTWMYFIIIPLLIDIVGIFASAIWFLFFYL